MTFDDILKSGDLFDGVWDTQRLTRALEDTVSAATQKKIERLLADRGLLFSVASDGTVCDEHERPVKRSVLAAIVDRAKAKRQRLLLWRPTNRGSIILASTTGARSASGYSAGHD